MFTKATKTKSRARIALMGPSGSGKTYTALSIAQGLGKKIALIDSEHGSASKYSDIFDFDSCELKSFGPRDYIKAIEEAHEYDVLIIDSISHEWNGRGGCLELVDKVTQSSDAKNSYTAWGKVTPQHNDFVEALLALPCHLIATLRVKMDYSMETNDKGKVAPVKVGLAPVQRDGVEYEFDILADINQKHILTITKTRYPALDGGEYLCAGKELGEEIASWLSVGEEAKAPDPKVLAMADSKSPLGENRRSGRLDKASQVSDSEWSDLINLAKKNGWLEGFVKHWLKEKESQPASQTYDEALVKFGTSAPVAVGGGG
jgi:hypothetical protein